MAERGTGAALQTSTCDDDDHHFVDAPLVVAPADPQQTRSSNNHHHHDVQDDDDTDSHHLFVVNTAPVTASNSPMMVVANDQPLQAASHPTRSGDDEDKRPQHLSARLEKLAQPRQQQHRAQEAAAESPAVSSARFQTQRSVGGLKPSGEGRSGTSIVDQDGRAASARSPSYKSQHAHAAHHSPARDITSQKSGAVTARESSSPNIKSHPLDTSIGKVRTSEEFRAERTRIRQEQNQHQQQRGATHRPTNHHQFKTKVEVAAEEEEKLKSKAQSRAKALAELAQTAAKRRAEAASRATVQQERKRQKQEADALAAAEKFEKFFARSRSGSPNQQAAVSHVHSTPVTARALYPHNDHNQQQLPPPHPTSLRSQQNLNQRPHTARNLSTSPTQQQQREGVFSPHSWVSAAEDDDDSGIQLCDGNTASKTPDRGQPQQQDSAISPRAERNMTHDATTTTTATTSNTTATTPSMSTPAFQECVDEHDLEEQRRNMNRMATKSAVETKQFYVRHGEGVEKAHPSDDEICGLDLPVSARYNEGDSHTNNGGAVGAIHINNNSGAHHGDEDEEDDSISFSRKSSPVPPLKGLSPSGGHSPFHKQHSQSPSPQATKHTAYQDNVSGATDGQWVDDDNDDQMNHQGAGRRATGNKTPRGGAKKDSRTSTPRGGGGGGGGTPRQFVTKRRMSLGVSTATPRAATARDVSPAKETISHLNDMLHQIRERAAKRDDDLAEMTRQRDRALEEVVILRDEVSRMDGMLKEHGQLFKKMAASNKQRRRESAERSRQEEEERSRTSSNDSHMSSHSSSGMLHGMVVVTSDACCQTLPLPEQSPQPQPTKRHLVTATTQTATMEETQPNNGEVVTATTTATIDSTEVVAHDNSSSICSAPQALEESAIPVVPEDDDAELEDDMSLHDLADDVVVATQQEAAQEVQTATMESTAANADEQEKGEDASRIVVAPTPAPLPPRDNHHQRKLTVTNGVTPRDFIVTDSDDVEEAEKTVDDEEEAPIQQQQRHHVEDGEPSLLLETEREEQAMACSEAIEGMMPKEAEVATHKVEDDEGDVAGSLSTGQDSFAVGEAPTMLLQSAPLPVETDNATGSQGGDEVPAAANITEGEVPAHNEQSQPQAPEHLLTEEEREASSSLPRHDHGEEPLPRTPDTTRETPIDVDIKELLKDMHLLDMGGSSTGLRIGGGGDGGLVDDFMQNTAAREGAATNGRSSAVMPTTTTTSEERPAAREINAGTTSGFIAASPAASPTNVLDTSATSSQQNSSRPYYLPRSSSIGSVASRRSAGSWGAASSSPSYRSPSRRRRRRRGDDDSSIDHGFKDSDRRSGMSWRKKVLGTVVFVGGATSLFVFGAQRAPPQQQAKLKELLPSVVSSAMF